LEEIWEDHYIVSLSIDRFFKTCLIVDRFFLIMFFLLKESILRVSADLFENNLTVMARELGIPYKQLQSYGIRSLPSCEVLNRFVDYGISSAFLLSGNESMFADNRQGQELRLKYAKEYSSGNYKIVSNEFINKVNGLLRSIK